MIFPVDKYCFLKKEEKDLGCRRKKVQKLIPIIAIGIMVILFVIVIKKSEQPLSVDVILKYTPENKILASIIILAFFALKSLTIIFPLSMLYFTNGILFQSLTAVLISTIGLAITITIPYLIGKCSGKEVIQKICKKYPKAEHIRRPILILHVL